MKNFRLLPILAVLFLYGCTETATIKVQNLVHNATLESINYGDYALAYKLIPGKTSDERTISRITSYNVCYTKLLRLDSQNEKWRAKGIEVKNLGWMTINEQQTKDKLLPEVAKGDPATLNRNNFV